MVEKNVSIINIDDERWLAYVKTKEEAMIFHHPNWLLNLCESYKYSPFVIAVVDNKNTISAGIPFAEIKSPITGHRWVSLPYTDYSFPLYNEADDLDLMIDHILDLYNSSQAPKVELRWEYPSRQGIKRTSNQLYHSKLLPQIPEDYFNALSSNTRRFIRLSRDRGVTVKNGTSIEFMKEFYNLQVLTRIRHGLPTQPWKYFKLLQKNLMEHDLGFILLAFSKEGHCIAGLVILHWNNSVTIKYAASGNKLKSELKPNDLLMWEAIKWASENGFKKIDEGRTACANSGLRRFKIKWGLEEKPLTYSTIGYPQHSMTESGFNRQFKKVIQHSPAFISRVTGEILYKHFS